MTQTAVFDALALTNSKLSLTSPPSFTSNIYRSNWFNVTAYRRLEVIVFSNQPLATDGVSIEQTTKTSPTDGSGGDADADYWTTSSTFGTTLQTNPITSVTGYNVAVSAERLGLNARLLIKHAGTAPTVLRARLGGAGIT